MTYTYTFWDRSAIFFGTAMAFVVALAWKDAVHSMFEQWFPVPGVVDATPGTAARAAWQRVVSKRTAALFLYALLITAAAIGILELIPKGTAAIRQMHRSAEDKANSESSENEDNEDKNGTKICPQE